MPYLSRIFRHPRILAFAAVFVATLLQTPQVPKYDASTYWVSAVDISHGQSPYVGGLLSLRGAWTSVLYLPAALLARVLNAASADFPILLENAVLVALVGAVLLPRVVRHFRAVGPRITFLCAALTWLILWHVAPYSLTDLWAVVLIVAALALADLRSPWALGLLGVCLAVAENIRPAYLVTAIALAVVVVVWRRVQSWPIFVGGLLALVPQTVVNLTHQASWLPWPPQTSSLMGIQATDAAFITRYDTVAYVPAPSASLTWCSETMARLAAANPPHSESALAAFFLRHPYQSAFFLLEKLGGALHWPLAAPYFADAGVADTLFAVVTTAIAVVGCVQLARKPQTAPQIMVVVVIVAALLTLATSQPETRFALPLLMLGVVGCCLLDTASRSRAMWAVGATVVVFVFGWLAMRHGIPASLYVPASCLS